MERLDVFVIDAIRFSRPMFGFLGYSITSKSDSVSTRTNDVLHQLADAQEIMRQFHAEEKSSRQQEEQFNARQCQRLGHTSDDSCRVVPLASVSYRSVKQWSREKISIIPLRPYTAREMRLRRERFYPRNYAQYHM